MPALGSISGLPALSSGPSGPSGSGESIISVASSGFGNPRHSFGSSFSSLAGSGVTVPTAIRPVGHQAQSVLSAACSLASDPATSAGLLSNMLPWAPPGSLAFNGVYVGEGLPPIPRKLAHKIVRWEYVEMAELLPEFWSLSKEEETEARRPTSRRPKQVTEFHTWLQCFATYSSVLGSAHTAAFPELMAYLVTISRVSQDFVGLAWVRYDAAFRRQAAITGNKKWSQINPSLYSICFTGKAQAAVRCELCLSVSHGSKQCPLQVEADPDLPIQLKAVESAVLSLAKPRLESVGTRSKSSEVCRLWNDNRCRFPKCKYRHTCSQCGEGHPVLRCPNVAQSSGEPAADPTPGVGRRQARRDVARPY